ncbi:MAG: hypothetical protein AB4038_08795, partial [Prochloraceae cyanobacterium]
PDPSSQLLANRSMSMFQLSLSEISSKLTVAFCFCCAWSLVILFCWAVWQAWQDGIVQLKRMHQIPCSKCTFFTHNYYLKCTVNPLNALSEKALNCRDFESDPEPNISRNKKCGKNLIALFFNSDSRHAKPCANSER